MGGSFSAQTIPGSGRILDPQLFLFDAAGLGVVATDDGNGAPGLQSRIAGNFAAGTYYLAISAFNNNALSAGGTIFNDAFPGQFGPTGLGGAQPLSGWSGGGTGGLYEINLEGAVGSVPEPGTLLLLGSGISAIVVRRRRRA